LHVFSSEETDGWANLDAKEGDMASADTTMEDLEQGSRTIPKVIDARAHAVIDYLTAGAFFALGYAMLGRHSRAAGFAMVNGVAVLTLSLLTDYPGGLFRTLSFRTHGTIDTMLAGMCAAGPAILGFAGDTEAQFFHGQALLETGVIAATDWNSF
jgi:hypothetical protein